MKQVLVVSGDPNDKRKYLCDLSYGTIVEVKDNDGWNVSKPYLEV